MRKGKSTSVDLGEGAKEEEEAAAEGGEEAAAEGGADGEAAAAAEETNDEDAVAEKTPAAESGGEVEKTPTEAPVTNGENGCSNGTAEENATHNHQDEEETSGSSPLKKSKEAGGVKEEANAKIINATAAVNSGELERAVQDSDELQNSSRRSSKEGDTNNRQQQQVPALTNDSICQELALAVRDEGEGEGDEGEEAESPHNEGGHDGAEQSFQGDMEREEEEEEMRKRDLREAAVAIVQDVMSAATDQLERELYIDNGLNGCYDADFREAGETADRLMHR